MTRRLKPKNKDERALCAAVALFSEKMRQKLLCKARSGKCGWNTVDPNYIAELFADHLWKGDPVDLANFLMMLDYRERGLIITRQASAPKREEFRSFVER